MKTLFCFLLIVVTACMPEDVNEKTTIKFSPSRHPEINSLNKLILGLQKSSLVNESVNKIKAADFFDGSPYQELKKNTDQNLQPLREDFYSITLSLTEKSSKSKQERCSDYEADIWWSVFWFMQQEPEVTMQEADQYAKKVSRWAYGECTCATAIE